MKRTLIYLNIGMTIVMILLLGCNYQKHSTEINDEPVENVVTEPEIIQYEEVAWEIPELKRDYEVQIMASSNLNALEKEQTLFLQKGYETKIVPVEREGATIFRLRLKERFTYLEAKSIADVVKNEFKTVKKTWIQKM
jgi:hypothetical protein